MEKQLAIQHKQCGITYTSDGHIATYDITIDGVDYSGDNQTRTASRYWNNFVPDGFFCLSKPDALVDHYKFSQSYGGYRADGVTPVWSEETIKRYTWIFRYYWSSTSSVYRKSSQRIWNNLNSSTGAILNTSAVDTAINNDSDFNTWYNNRTSHVVGYRIFIARDNPTYSTAWSGSYYRSGAQPLIRPVWGTTETPPTKEERDELDCDDYEIELYKTDEKNSNFLANASFSVKYAIIKDPSMGIAGLTTSKLNSLTWKNVGTYQTNANGYFRVSESSSRYYNASDRDTVNNIFVVYQFKETTAPAHYKNSIGAESGTFYVNVHIKVTRNTSTVTEGSNTITTTYYTYRVEQMYIYNCIKNASGNIEVMDSFWMYQKDHAVFIRKNSTLVDSNSNGNLEDEQYTDRGDNKSSDQGAIKGYIWPNTYGTNTTIWVRNRPEPIYYECSIELSKLNQAGTALNGATFHVDYEIRDTGVNASSIRGLSFPYSESDLTLNNSSMINVDKDDYNNEKNTYFVYRFQEATPPDGFKLDNSYFYLVFEVNYNSSTYTYTPGKAELYYTNSSGTIVKGSETNHYLTCKSGTTSKDIQYFYDAAHTDGKVTINIKNEPMKYNLYVRKINKHSTVTDTTAGANGAQFAMSVGGSAIKAGGNDPTTTNGWIKVKDLKAGTATASLSIQELTAPANMLNDHSTAMTGTIYFKDGKIEQITGTDSWTDCTVQIHDSITIDNETRENVILVTVKDTPHYELMIRKVNSKNTSQGINGARFYLSDGNLSGPWGPTDTVDGVDGILKYNSGVSGNYLGFKLQETSAPANVRIDEGNVINMLDLAYFKNVDGSISIKVSGTETNVVASSDTDYQKWTTKKTYGGYTVYYNINPNRIVIEAKDTPFITPKIKIIKVDRNDHSTKLGSATFKVNIPDVNTNYTTNSSGETSVITLKTIDYGTTSGISGTIQETIAPIGYRVDNKNPITLKMWYNEDLSTHTFENNKLYVEFVGDHNGYSINNLVSGKSYINGDTIEILVTDTPIKANLKLIKQDYDTRKPIPGITFIVPDPSNPTEEKKEVQTDANGEIYIQNIPLEIIDDTDKLNLQQNYLSFVSNGGGVYDTSNGGWNASGIGVSGTLYDTEKNTTAWLNAYHTRSDGKKDVYKDGEEYYVRNHDATIFFVEGKSGDLATNEIDNYYTPYRSIGVYSLLDEQGCVYSVISYELLGKGYFVDLSVEEKMVDGVIEDTVIATVVNSPIYTLDLHKLEKKDGEAGVNSSIELRGAEYKAVRLIGTDYTTISALASIGNRPATISTSKLKAKETYREEDYASSEEWEKVLSLLVMGKTEQWTKNNQSEQAILEFWHEDFRHEEQAILYQIKEIRTPDGYKPKNFYLLVNTDSAKRHDGHIEVHIGYEENGTIYFNRENNNNTVNIRTISQSRPKPTIYIEVGNEPIRYDLKIHKVDIYNNSFNISNTEFKIDNVGRRGVNTPGETVTGTTDQSGYINLGNYRVPDIRYNSAGRKIITVTETSIPNDYMLLTDQEKPVYIQLTFKINGVIYENLRDVLWDDTGNAWNQDDANYGKVEVIATLKSDANGNTNLGANQIYSVITSNGRTVDMTVRNTPIVSLNLNKFGAKSNSDIENLSGTTFTIKEYKQNVNQINQSVVNTANANESNWENIKLFSGTDNTLYTTQTDIFSGNSNIRFLADKNGVLLKITENAKNTSESATSAVEHYSKIYKPFYIYIKNGNIVTLMKDNEHDRIRLNIETNNNSGYTEFTQKTQENLTIWNGSYSWTGTGTRHQFGVDVVDLTETWIDMKKIFLGMDRGNVTGSATFEISANNLKAVSDDTRKNTITISASETGSGTIDHKYAKFYFEDNFENDKTLTTTFTVKETTNIYNTKGTTNQYWGEIPEFKFNIKYKKHNNGYIEIESIGEPEATNTTFTKTIRDLYTLKYHNTDRYIDITNSGDKNATVRFVLRNPQVKSFDFIISKYDRDKHLTNTHPDRYLSAAGKAQLQYIEALQGIPFKIVADTKKNTQHEFITETGQITIGGRTEYGSLSVCLDITDEAFRKDNQSQNCLIDTTETIIFHVTELSNDNNKYYKYRREEFQVEMLITINPEGYYCLDENFNASGQVNNSSQRYGEYNKTTNAKTITNAGTTKTTIYTTSESADLTGVARPGVCSVYTNYTRISLDMSNKRRWVVIEGSVWEDIYSNGKVSEVNGLKDTDESFLKGITVKLHKNETGKKEFQAYSFNIQKYSTHEGNEINTFKGVYNLSPADDTERKANFQKMEALLMQEEILEIETTTDENGHYVFAVPMYEGNYWVEFIYNGYRYQHTKYTPANKTGKKDGKIASNATETETIRNQFNQKYSTITKDTNTDNNINKTLPTDTQYRGVNIIISAFSGGHGNVNPTTFSASKNNVVGENNQREALIDNETGNNGTNDRANVNTSRKWAGNVLYDYVYQENLGITPREEAHIGVSKSVKQVLLQVPSFQNGAVQQVYLGTDGIVDMEPKEGDNATTLQNKSVLAEKFAGEYSQGIRLEDEYTTTENVGAEDIHDVKAFITYRVALYNYSSELGIKFNQIVDYYDNTLTLKGVNYVKINAAGQEEYEEIPQTSWNQVGDKNLKIYHEDKSDSGDTRTFKEVRLNLEKEIDHHSMQYIDFIFEMEVKPDNIIQTDASGKITDSIEEVLRKTKTNVVEVTSYSTYYCEDGLNVENANSYTYNEHPKAQREIAGIVDSYSNPENVDGIRETNIGLVPYQPYIHEEDDGIAFARFIEQTERTLSGNVWIESRRNRFGINVEGAVIGNGINERTGNGYKGVRVELYNSATNELAKTWDDTRKIYTTDNSTKWTVRNGDYEAFKGIPIGDYYILFTYPNGQTYKSTTFNHGSTSNGFNVNDPDNNVNVKFNINTTNKYSYARDILGNNDTTPGTRKYVNKLLSTGDMETNKAGNSSYNTYNSEHVAYESGTSNAKKAVENSINMEAKTGHIIIPFEMVPVQTNPNIGLDNESPHSLNLAQVNAITWQIRRQFKVETIDFGVVERPQSQLKINLDIENVRLELSNGNILFDASGKATNVMWVSGTDDNEFYYENDGYKVNEINNKHIFAKNIGSGESYIRYTNRKRGSVVLTMDEELMQGATIKIKYKITVTNIGEIDYKDNEFYYLGKENNRANNIVKTTPLQIIDYVGYQAGDGDHVTRNNLNYVQKFNTNTDTWNEKEADNLKDSGLLNATIAGIAKEKYNTVVVHNTNASNNKLVPYISKDYGQDEKKAEYTTHIVLSRKISSDSETDDLTYNNLVEILQIKNDVGRRTQFSTVGNQDPTKTSAELDADDTQGSGSGVVIIPPFGEKQPANGPEIVYINETYDIRWLYIGTGILILAVGTWIVVSKHKKKI